jgi:hypothetical protein
MEAGKYMAGTYLAPSAQKLGYLLRNLEQPMYEFDGIVHQSIQYGTGGKRHCFFYYDAKLQKLPEKQIPLPNM